MSLWNDFKAFAFKGNVIELAIAVVIGAAFQKIVSSLVDGLIMPLVGKLLPSSSYVTWAPGGVKVGLLIGAVIDFLIVAFVLFIVISLIRRAMVKPTAPAAPPEPSAEAKLLAEIRDELRARR